MVLRGIRNYLERRRIRDAFSQYLSPEMAELGAGDPSRLRLGGEAKSMSFLVCELRDYEVVAETYRDDLQAQVSFVNRYLGPMTDEIMAGDGTVDKFNRDRIMAFWNAPLEDADHARHACAAALAMRDAIDRLNEDIAPDLPELDIVVGINTGECIVGNMGSDQRFDYSVMGHPVTLAYRFMSAARDRGIDIVIGEATRVAAPEFATRPMSPISLDGGDIEHMHALVGASVDAER